MAENQSNPAEPDRKAVVIAYAGVDQPMARELCKALAFPGVCVFCDSYPAIGPLDGFEDERHLIRTRAEVLLVINPRSDADRAEPAAAIRDFAKATRGKPDRRVYVVLCGAVEVDTSVSRALRKAGLPRVLLTARLLNDEHHQPASMASMEEVGRELGVKLSSPYVPAPLTSRVRWRGAFRRFRRTKIGFVIVACAGAAWVVTETMDVLGGARDFIHSTFGEKPPVGTKAPPRPPRLSVTLRNPATNLPYELNPDRLPPALAETLTIRTTPEAGRCNYLVILQPEAAPTVHAVAASDVESAYRALTLPLTEPGTYTVLAISTPAGATNEQEIAARVTKAVAAARLALPEGVWFAWNGDRHERVYPMGGKGSPSVAGKTPEEDVWAIALREALFADPKAVDFSISGWSVPVSATASGGPP